MPLADDSFSYNGYNFDTFTKTKVSSTPVWDDARRLVKYLEILIEVRGYLAGGTDASMQTLRRVLSAPGKRLQYNSRGFGLLDVGPDGPVYDVNYGPKPGRLGYVAIGAPNACAFEWSVTVCIPECRDSVYRGALMAGNYEVDYNIDEQGLTTITVSGAIEVPLMLVNGGNALPDHADAYRERCFPAVPLGYQRVTKKFLLSNDRKRGTFTYVDKEIPIPLPLGCTMADVKHRIKNKKRMALSGPYDCNISGTLRTNPAIPKATALDRFLRIVLSRLRVSNVLNDVTEDGQNRGAITVEHFDVTENIYGLDSSFSLSYMLTSCTSLTQAIMYSGLWRPINATPNDQDPDSTFERWRDSLAENAHNPRGTRFARYNTGEDTLIDLCMPGRANAVRPQASVASASGPVTDEENSARVFPPVQTMAAAMNAEMERILPIVGGLPDPEFSWLEYETNLSYQQDNNIAVHKPLAGTVTVTTPKVDPTAPDANFSSQTVVETLVQASVPDITQRISSPSVRVILSGFAERYGHQVNPPRLVKFAGKDVEEMRAVIQPNQLVKSLNGVPVYRTSWAILYIVKTPPAVLPVLANPLNRMAEGNGLAGGATAGGNSSGLLAGIFG